MSPTSSRNSFSPRTLRDAALGCAWLQVVLAAKSFQVISPPANANLIANGDFSQPVVSGFETFYPLAKTTLPSAVNSIQGWKVGANSVDVIGHGVLGAAAFRFPSRSHSLSTYRAVPRQHLPDREHHSRLELPAEVVRVRQLWMRSVNQGHARTVGQQDHCVPRHRYRGPRRVQDGLVLGEPSGGGQLGPIRAHVRRRHARQEPLWRRRRGRLADGRYQRLVPLHRLHRRPDREDRGQGRLPVRLEKDLGQGLLMSGADLGLDNAFHRSLLDVQDIREAAGMPRPLYRDWSRRRCWS